MRKIILAALAASTLAPVAAPVAASAQSYREVRDSEREVRQSQRDFDRARRYGDRDDVRDARRELREDRRELREDWRDYRRNNRNVFRPGAYRGPNGYRYRPIGVGYQFAPSYYGRNYWVDYRRYRLDAPRFGYQRWIRYGNDVALVDTRSGRVVRVYNRFFW